MGNKKTNIKGCLREAHEHAMITLEQVKEPDGAETSGGGQTEGPTSGQEGLRVSLLALMKPEAWKCWKSWMKSMIIRLMEIQMSDSFF